MPERIRRLANRLPLLRAGVLRTVSTLLICAAASEVFANEFGLVSIPAGRFTMGDLEGEPDEIPREAVVGAFQLMRNEVTNAQFSAFVENSGYVTDAEKSGSGYVWNGKWQLVAGADWRHPAGPHSTITGKELHPVVQVSVNDARRFCAHHGLRLPSEQEWERAARGDDGRRFPWGNEPPEQNESSARRANFGTVACFAPDSSDGYLHTAPVGSFPLGASPYGIEDLAGNVWEWTASPFPGEPDDWVLRGGGWGNNPYCLRSAYRHGNPPNIALDMVGIRCAFGD